MKWEEMDFDERVNCCVETFRDILLSAHRATDIHIEFNWNADNGRAVFVQDVTSRDFQTVGYENDNR